MMEKILFIYKDSTEEINREYLEKGWKVKTIVPFSCDDGNLPSYGAYVVVEK